MKATPTTIGKPEIRTWYDGIRLTPSDIPNAFAILAMFCDPTGAATNWEAVDKLGMQAQSAMTDGVATLPSLTVALLSKAATGSYIAGRDALNQEFHARGGRNFLFEHNASSMLPPFEQVSITIRPLTADHQVLEMKVRPIGVPKVFTGLERPLQHQLAHDAELPMILTSVSVGTPLQITDHSTRYRLDLAPFADALRKHGFTPGEHAGFKQATGRNFADRIEQWCHKQTRNAAPVIQLALPDGYVLELGLHGCMLSTYDTWEQARTVHCTRTGTEFSGPISTQFGSTELETPELYCSLRGEALHLPEREAALLKLVAELAASITDYHNN